MNSNLSITDIPYPHLPAIDTGFHGQPIGIIAPRKNQRIRFSVLPDFLVGAEWTALKVQDSTGKAQAPSEVTSRQVGASASHLNLESSLLNLEPSATAVDVFLAFNTSAHYFSRTTQTALLEQRAPVTDIPIWLAVGPPCTPWQRLYPAAWRGLQTSEEPATSKTHFYALYRRRLEPGEKLELSPLVASNTFLPPLLFITPPVDDAAIAAAAGEPPDTVISSPNSTRLTRPKRAFGKIQVPTGKVQGSSDATMRIIVTDEDGDVELDTTDVQFTHADAHLKFETSLLNLEPFLTPSSRHTLHAITRANGFTTRASANFAMHDDAPENLNLEPSLLNLEPFNVRLHGAVGDNTTNDLPAFVAAVGACHKNRGGTVLVPPGEYLLDGPVEFCDNMNLHLEEGAVLRFAFNPKNYPNRLTMWGGNLIINYTPLIFADRKRNVALTGRGVVDGNNTTPFKGWDFWMCGLGWRNPVVPFNAMQERNVTAMQDACDARLPLHLRLFGHDPAHPDPCDTGTERNRLRPDLCHFFQCQNVLVEGVTFRNAPCYNLVLTYCRDAVVRAVTIQKHFHWNDDGIVINSCRRVLVEHCDVATRDDAVCPKAGMNQDAWDRGPCSDILIRRNTIRAGDSPAGCVAIGSNMSGGVFRVLAHDNRMPACPADCWKGPNGVPLYIKSSGVRGGEVSHIRFKDFVADESTHAVWLQTSYPLYGAASGDYPSDFNDILVENLLVHQTRDEALKIEGLPESPITNLVLKNVTIRNPGQPPLLAHVAHTADNLVIK